jgi:hypothetical protein
VADQVTLVDLTSAAEAAAHANQLPIEASAVLPVASAAEANLVLAKARGMQLLNDGDYAAAADFAIDCKTASEREDKNRVALKKKFLDGCRDIDNYFREPIAIYDAAFKQVKAVMKSYDERKRLEAAAERKRQDDIRAAAEAEERRLAKIASDKALAEEQARREAQAAAEREARAKVEAAEAETRKANEARLAAEARARGDQEAAAAANARAAKADEDAKAALAQGKIDREAAIEARRAQLKAESATQSALSNMDAATQVSQTAALASVLAQPAKVSGVARKSVWRWRMLDETLLARKWMTADRAKMDDFVGKNKAEAAQHFDGAIEVYEDFELAIGSKKK